MYKLCLSLLMVAVTPVLVSAGGGDTKSHGFVQVTNQSQTQVALAAVDPSSSLRSATTASQFRGRGGAILNPGESHTFNNIKQGVHNLVFTLVAPGTTTVNSGAFASQQVRVSNGNTTHVTLP